MPWCPAFQGDQVILINVSRDKEAVSLHTVSIESPHGLQAYYIQPSVIEADFARAILGRHVAAWTCLGVASDRFTGREQQCATEPGLLWQSPPSPSLPVPGSPVSPDRRTPRNPRCRSPATTGSNSPCGSIPITAASTAAGGSAKSSPAAPVTPSRPISTPHSSTMPLTRRYSPPTRPRAAGTPTTTSRRSPAPHRRPASSATS